MQKYKGKKRRGVGPSPSTSLVPATPSIRFHVFGRGRRACLLCAASIPQSASSSYQLTLDSSVVSPFSANFFPFVFA